MSLGKKQAQFLNERYKRYYKVMMKELYGDLKSEFEVAITELEQIMKVLNYNNDDFINLKNEVMEETDPKIYYEYLQLNNIINEITGNKKLFVYEYEPKRIYNIIDYYDYDRRIGSLYNKLDDIKKIINTNKEIRIRLEKQLEYMIAQ